MMQLKRSSAHAIDTVFILVLLTLFGITSLFVILTGAKQYQSIADQMSENYETRTISSYLEEKINQSDIAGSCSVVELSSTDGMNTVDALALTQITNDQSYTTYIYAYDGYLWEITVTSDSVVALGSGQKIIETGGLTIDVLSDHLYQFAITDTAGDVYSLYVSLNSK